MKTNISIACDHGLFRERLAALLGSSGHCVLSAVADGQKLIDTIKQKRPFPDVCILDYRMPVLDGIATLRYIKENWPFIRIIVCTNNSNPDIRDFCLQAGADGFWDKSGHIETLSSQIARLAEWVAP